MKPAPEETGNGFQECDQAGPPIASNATSPSAPENQTVESFGVECLRLRAWARAYLWAIGMVDLYDAIDPLQEAATRNGIVAAIGQDRVQAIFAAEFRSACQVSA